MIRELNENPLNFKRNITETQVNNHWTLSEIQRVEQLMCGKGESSLSGQGLPMALPLQLHSAADAVDAINQLVLSADREDIFL